MYSNFCIQTSLMYSNFWLEYMFVLFPTVLLFTVFFYVQWLLPFDTIAMLGVEKYQLTVVSKS